MNLYSEKEIEEIKKLSDITEENRLLNIIYLLSDLENDLKWSSQKTIMFQTGIIKACRKDTLFSNADGSALEKRLQLLENKLANMQQDASSIVGVQVVDSNKTSSEKENEKKDTKQIANSSIDVAWKKVIETLKRSGKIRLYTALINTKINELNDLVWEIEFPNGLTSFNQKILDMPENNNELTKAILKATGKEIHVRYKDGKTTIAKKETKESQIKDLGIDINIIE